MSGYGKASQPSDYHDTRSSESPQYPSIPAVYGSYTPQNHYSAQTSAQSQARHRPISQDQQPEQHSLNEPLYSPRQQYVKTEMNVVGGCEPSTGAEGTHFSVYVRSDADLLRSQRSFWFLFGEHRYNASNPKLSRQSNDYQISGEVPALRGTGWGHPHVKVILVAEDADGEETRMEVRGGFTYTDTPAQQNSSYRSPPLSNRKRKASADSVDHISPPKRAITQPIRPKSEDYGPYGYSTSSSAQYAPYVSTSNDRSYVYSAGYDHDAGAQATYQASPRNFSYSYAGPSDLPQTSPATSHGWPAHFPSSESVGILPSPAETHAQNPLLIRTSTLQQVDKGGDGHSNRGPGPGFPHYSMYPNNKAVLKIQGELSEMALHWTSEEWDSGRRLVQFWRQQNGSTIHATFRPVPQSDRPSANTNTICVSCIWWAERKECYVTSVDCIYLLESLIGVRFTVEEKNRIRRNLEGFRPLTVSKGKKECESFFKLIMQFPSPKPRNIEKDVKVFAWSILPHALKKIIGKYSASYSSTAAIIPQNPGASPYPGAPSPHDIPHPRASDSMPPRTTSPPGVMESISSRASSTANTLLAAAASLPMNSNSSTTSPVSRSGGLPDPPISLPVIIPPPTAHSIWQQSQSLPATPHSLGPPNAHAHRSSWDVAPYLDTAPASAGGYYHPGQRSSEEDQRGPVSSGAHTPPHGSSNVGIS